MLDDMFKESVTLMEFDGTFSDGKPNYTQTDDVPSIELPFTLALRDSFGNVEATTLFVLQIDRKVDLDSAIVFDGKQYKIIGSQAYKNPETLDIEACGCAV